MCCLFHLHLFVFVFTFNPILFINLQKNTFLYKVGGYSRIVRFSEEIKVKSEKFRIGSAYDRLLSARMLTHSSILSLATLDSSFSKEPMCKHYIKSERSDP